MTNKLEIYKCNVCGNVIEVLIAGDGHPVCCGEEMVKLEVQNDNQNSPSLTEKHSPVIEGNKISIHNHPMEDKHYIMFIQAVSKDNNEIKTKYFYPNDELVMTFDLEESEIFARSYCNIHGLYVNN